MKVEEVQCAAANLVKTFDAGLKGTLGNELIQLTQLSLKKKATVLAMNSFFTT